MSVRPIPVSAQHRPPVSQTGDLVAAVSSIRTVESSRFTTTIRPGTIRSVRISPLRNVRVGRTYCSLDVTGPSYVNRNSKVASPVRVPSAGGATAIA